MVVVKIFEVTQNDRKSGLSELLNLIVKGSSLRGILFSQTD